MSILRMNGDLILARLVKVQRTGMEKGPPTIKVHAITCVCELLLRNELVTDSLKGSVYDERHVSQNVNYSH